MTELATHIRLYTRRLPMGLIALLLASTACTQQQAAQVVLNGQNSYGRSGPVTGASGVYSSNAIAAPVASVSASNTPGSISAAPVSQTTYASAGSSSIGVSDLAAPSSSSSSVAVADAAPITSSSAAAPVTSAPAPLVTASADNTQGQTKLKWTTPANDASRSASHVATPTAADTSKGNGSVNLWTGQQHFSQTAKTSQNTIASNDVAELKPAAGKPQPASALVAQNVKPATNSGYMWPVSSKKIINSFGPKGGGRVSDGIDIASAEGEPVWAAADGEVVFVGDELKGFGNMVLIKHQDGKTTNYAHMSRLTVDKYDRVKQGDIIGYVGSTGNVRSAQLHFGVNDGKTALDPQKYLSSSVASN